MILERLTKNQLQFIESIENKIPKITVWEKKFPAGYSNLAIVFRKN